MNSLFGSIEDILTSKMKIYKVEFEGVYPVGNCCVIAARSFDEATQIARDTILHDDQFKVIPVNINQPCVIVYLSGDY